MPTPKSREQELCEMFDSFSHKTISNLGKYARRKYFSYKNRFSVYDPLVMQDMGSHTDDYPSYRYVVFADELCCYLNYEYLFNAFKAMPINQRKVLILDFWHRWKAQKIAEYLEVSVRTVYNLRQRAYRTILLHDQQQGQDT